MKRATPILFLVLLSCLFAPSNCSAQFTNLWKIPLPGRCTDTAPAISADGTLYQPAFDGTLFAITPNGQTNWQFKTGLEIESSPAIGSDGTIYFGSRDRKFYAVGQNGALKWTFETGAWNDSSPAIGEDGTIYFGSWNKLFYALDPNGSLKWKFPTAGIINSSPAIGADGTIYFGSHDKKLYALTPEGKLKWSFSTGAQIISSPAIGDNGVIYFTSTDGNLYALKPDGGELWHLLTGGASQSSPVLGRDGTIYLGADRFAIAVSAEGKRLWLQDFGYWIEGAPAATDSAIYFSSRSVWMIALSPANGTMEWGEPVGGEITASPTVSKDGVVYIAGNGSLMAIVPTNAAPPANSPWPMFRANARHTGCVEALKQ
jgi:outer membrane protein assembly factor BamB